LTGFQSSFKKIERLSFSECKLSVLAGNCKIQWIESKRTCTVEMKGKMKLAVPALGIKIKVESSLALENYGKEFTKRNNPMCNRERETFRKCNEYRLCRLIIDFSDVLLRAVGVLNRLAKSKGSVDWSLNDDKLQGQLRPRKS
jgi:hypothetical protein